MNSKLILEDVQISKPYEKTMKDGQPESHVFVQYMGGEIDLLVSSEFLREIKLNKIGTAVVDGEIVPNAEIWKAKDGREGAFIETPFKMRRLIGFTPAGSVATQTLSGANKVL